jgi:hypothetical protein
MTVATRRDIVAVLGPVDDATVVEIIGMGVEVEELAEAQAWIINDEALMNAGRPLATGRVHRLVEIMATLEESAGADAVDGELSAMDEEQG